MVRRLMTLAVLVAVLPACRGEPSTSVQNAAARDERPALEQLPLQIRSSGKVHAFTVEVARTSAEQARGLMFRESLAPDAGMIFPFESPRPASFWMKNTLIPLDMLFIRSDGSIARIAVNTVPHSLDPVGVNEPVAAVLELAGGRSAELGISEGDRVTWPGGPTL